LKYPGVPGGPKRGNSTINTQRKVTKFLNQIQLNAREPLRNKMNERFNSLKEQVISLSSKVQKFNRVRKSKNIGEPSMKRPYFGFLDQKLPRNSEEKCGNSRL
jgi:hypothetical protein